jgi:hypothetical protein
MCWPPMLIFRFLMVFLLMSVVVSMGFYMATGRVWFRQLAILLVRWGVLAAAGFFGVLMLERLI